MMDLTTVATMLGVSAHPVTNGSSPVDAPSDAPKPPPWWPGDDAAAESSIEAARQMGFAVGSVN